MKIQIKISNTFLLLVFLNIFFPISMLSIVNACGDGEDNSSAAMVQWYSQVYQFTKTNENITQNIIELEGKLQQLERKLEECMNNGDIVIQRRQDGSVDFFRNWAEYKKGFGNSSGEFFIGLEKLHKLTNSRPYELLIVLEDWENDRRYAKYDQFIIGSETEKYVLKEIGTYSGSAGDALRIQLGQKFSTKDQDNDAYSGHCAVEYTGAWWYNKCHQSNLNGRYLKSTDTIYAQGINWYQFKGDYYSLKFVEMIIRPR